MTADQIDKVCVDWLQKNYGEEFATQYGPYSLLIPMWNTIEFNEALGTLMQVLRIAFGPDESFGTIGYYESRRKLKLSDDRTPIPGVFLKALVESCERGRNTCAYACKQLPPLSTKWSVKKNCQIC